MMRAILKTVQFILCLLTFVFPGEIADMSLCILSALLQFRPKHLPERKINVRIGVHTGSCCAGNFAE